MLDYLPIVAAAFGIPQYLPQILKLRLTQDTAGLSWPWAALTSLNNAAWLAYFLLSHYWTASIPSSAAATLAGTVAVMLARRGLVTTRAAILVGGWAVLLVTSYAVAGRAGLGTLLAAASIIQVTPSIWTAYRTARPTGISRGTWLLLLGELSCWTVFGLYQSDARLISLGITGVIASLLMLARILLVTRAERRVRSARPEELDSLRT
ncbi:PQ-loop domain-containing transporter [Kribbella catacumbae]|uniref:PQ-loop domain-containing transporter n=1 Tax=Kribbella catacumbae TaxID=460086 RepID=UPI000A009776|nr:PQ-loop domain-containing transporter [Kribbella catacumbae]